MEKVFPFWQCAVATRDCKNPLVVCTYLHVVSWQKFRFLKCEVWLMICTIPARTTKNISIKLLKSSVLNTTHYPFSQNHCKISLKLLTCNRGSAALLTIKHFRGVIPKLSSPHNDSQHSHMRNTPLKIAKERDSDTLPLTAIMFKPSSFRRSHVPTNDR